MEVIAADQADEALLLDLLNTTPVLDGVPHDELDDPTAARAWLHRHGIAPTPAELTTVRAARAILQDVVRGERKPTQLQRFVADVTLEPVADADGLSWRLARRSGPAGAARAVLAWDALRRTSPGRLRPCANDECRLFLIDRSKPNTARWCSMAVCGNRMKARRHYQRARA
jgi:predicted RNA-binding Zn ribbon-like protein